MRSKESVPQHQSARGESSRLRRIHFLLLTPHSLRLLASHFLLLTACYTYRPVTAPAPQLGSRVDLQLTDEGSRALAAQVGPETEHLRGLVLAADTVRVELAVQGVENTRGVPTDWNGEQVEVPRRYVQRIQERQLSVGGTGILGGAVAASLIAAYELFGGGSNAQGPLGGGPGGAPR